MERINGSIADVVNRLVKEGSVNPYFTLLDIKKIVSRLSKKSDIYIANWMMDAQKKPEFMKTGMNFAEKGFMERALFYNAKKKENYDKWLDDCKKVLNRGENLFNSGDFFNEYITSHVRGSMSKKEVQDIVFTYAKAIGAEFLEGQWPTKMSKIQGVDNKVCALSGTLIDLGAYPFFKFLDEILSQIQAVNENRNDPFYFNTKGITPSSNPYTNRLVCIPEQNNMEKSLEMLCVKAAIKLLSKAQDYLDQRQRGGNRE